MLRRGRVLDLGPIEPEPVLIGIEHEYRVLDGDRQVDFRGLVHGYNLGVRHLDPGDPNAYRLETGAALTCDAAEAEIALPPVALRPGFTRELVARADYERGRLEALVAPLTIEGYSTHVSISTTSDIGDEVALLFAQTFAPGLMLLMDRASSPGLLVRPRPGRTELGGDFVDGAKLAVAATYAAAAVLCCHSKPSVSSMRLDVRLQPDDHRYGCFVDRRAFCEDDLYEAGRECRVRRRGTGTISARQHITETWAIARREIAVSVATSELEAVDTIVHGDATLALSAHERHRDLEEVDVVPRSSFGLVLQPRHRPTFSVAPVMVTWSLVVLVAVTRERSCGFLAVPRRTLDGYLAALEAGVLDDVLPEHLDGRLSTRRVSASSLRDSFALFSRLGRRRRLLPRERGSAGSVGLVARGNARGSRLRQAALAGRRRKWR